MNYKSVFYPLFIIFCLVIGCEKEANSNKNYFSQETNNVIANLNQSKNKSLENSERFVFVKKAKDGSINIENDSLLAQSLLQFVRLSYQLNQKDSIKKYYPQSLVFSQKNNDTIVKALTHNYAAYSFLKENNNDSAYYHFYNGSKYFKLLDNEFMTGKMLLNMAIIQKNKRDYVGSETTSIKALNHLLKTNKSSYIASTYNNLGIISDELKKLEMSVLYHRKALNIRKSINNKPILEVESLNNIATAYKDNGDIENAIIYYDSIKVFKKLLEKHPKVKARVIDNVAHTKLLKGNLSTLKNMNEALLIRVLENDFTGIMVSYLHLSEYYQLIGEPEKAYEYAIKAKELSHRKQNYRDLLKALRLLSTSKIKNNNDTYIQEYYRISDSLEKENNLISDHFARIRFETDEKDKENKSAYLKIDKQNNTIKNRNIIIWLLIGIALLILILLFIIKKASRYKSELYKEFNHRTRNNLVEIQRGVMKVKKNNANKYEIQELESITQSQLLLYSILEQDNHPTHISINDYLEKLVGSLLFIYQDYSIIPKFELKSIKVTSKKASLIGLIVNEFLTNAFKYGFSKLDSNNLIVSINESDKRIRLVVRASGEEWNPKSALGKGDGINLMYSLSKKASAKIEIKHSKGITSLILIF